MEFKSFVDDLADFIEDNLPGQLTTLKTKYSLSVLDDPSNYVKNQYPDTDKYGKYSVYVIVPEYSFEELSNESNAMESLLRIYVTFLGQNVATLGTAAAVYAEALFDIVKADSTLGGIVDYSMISRCQFFDGVEGVQSAKALYIEVKAVKEI